MVSREHMKGMLASFGNALAQLLGAAVAPPLLKKAGQDTVEEFFPSLPDPRLLSSYEATHARGGVLHLTFVWDSVASDVE